MELLFSFLFDLNFRLLFSQSAGLFSIRPFIFKRPQSTVHCIFLTVGSANTSIYFLSQVSLRCMLTLKTCDN